MRTLAALCLWSVLTTLPCCADSRPMAAGDPNLDPAWNWMAQAQYEVYGDDPGQPERRQSVWLP
jgi:hypothetical protein